MERLESYDSERLLIDKPYYKTVGFPLLEQTWLFASILIVQYFIIDKLIPQLMLLRKALDLRPYMLVLNGLNFGTYGCGIVVLAYAFNLSRDAWKCGRKPDGLRESGIIYAGYLYMIMKMFENISYMIMALRKKPDQRPAKMALSNMYHLCLLYFTLKYRPVFVFMMEPFMEATRSAMKYAYYTLRSAKPTNSLQWMKKLILTISILTYALNIYHMSSLIALKCRDFSALQYSILIGSTVEMILCGKNLLEQFLPKSKLL